MHARDLGTMVLVALLAGCGGGESGDPTGDSSGGTGSAGTDGGTEPTGGEATAGVTTDPTDGVVGAVRVCTLPMAPAVDDVFTNVTMAVDPSGDHLYVSVRDKAYRWSILGGADCELELDAGYAPTLTGEATDMEVTLDGQVFATVESDSNSPRRIWPEDQAGVCYLGLDESVGAQSIAVGGEGKGLRVGGTDENYNTMLYGLTDDPMCVLDTLWTETGMHDVGYRTFVVDGHDRMHALGSDPDGVDIHAMLVFAIDGSLATTYKPTEGSLCTASTMARCGADICVMSCSTLYRFADDGTQLSRVDLAEMFDDFSGDYIGIAGTSVGAIYVLKLDGSGLSVVRFGT